MTQYYHKFIKSLALILLFALPFNGLISTFARFELGLGNFWMWKEIILLAILVFNLFWFHDFGIFKKRLNILIIVYCLFMLASVLWAPDTTLARVMAGTKYDLFFFVAYFAGATFGGLSADELKSFLKAIFWGGGLALSLGLILHFVLGPENFTIFGYRNDWSTSIATQAPAFCQKIENSDLCRFQGTFSGPNQAAFYILFYLPIAFYFFRLKKTVSASIFIAASLFALAITFTRSAYLSLLIEIPLICYTFYRAFFIKYKSYVFVFVALAFIFLIGIVSLYPQNLLRPLSSSEHLQAWAQGFEEFTKSPLIGQGLATAGPASSYVAGVAATSVPIIPENWFLQIAVEGGVIALGLFVAIYFLLLTGFWKMKSETSSLLFVIFTALLVPLMLLHVFEDSSLAYSLFFVAGALMSGCTK